MPKELTGLHIFIASPGGLADERKAFVDVIERVNHDHAHAAGVTFIPRGWEYASAGVGRPQELINEQVRESDYLVVLLWDKWGKPPGGGKYTSGTQEEYAVAVESLKDADGSMQDIVVLFKGVNERQMADPGDDLKKVLNFKDELEKSRLLLYSTFDNIEEFRDDFRRHLHSWIRDWQGERSPKIPPSPSSLPSTTQTTEGIEGENETLSGSDLVARAKQAADRGRLTIAEQLFAKATTGQYDRGAFTEYVRFLRKSGRLSLAQDAAQTFLELAQDADDHTGEVEALANLAILERQQGRNESSLVYLQKALGAIDEYLRSMGLEGGKERQTAMATKAFLLDNESLTLRRLPGRSIEALSRLDDAGSAQREAGDDRGAGFTMRNKGSLLLRMGRLDDAEEALKSALEIFENVAYESGQSAALGSLAELFEAKGEFDTAIEMLDRSIVVSPQRTPSRNAMNYGILSRIHLKKGDLEQARVFAESCSRFAQELGTAESQAMALHCEAALARFEGKTDVARVALQESLSMFEHVENPVGVAAVSLDLARLGLLDGNPSEAARHANRAIEMLAQSPHFLLDVEARSLIKEIESAG